MEKTLILFGKKLKDIRNKRKYTLEKLSEMADITPNHLKKLESAKACPSFKTICNLASALNIEIGRASCRERV